MSKIFYILVIVLSVSIHAFSNTAPVVGPVTAIQRTDGSKVVDIRYNLSDADGDTCTVTLQVSSDGGTTWTVQAVTFLSNSAIGSGVRPGNGKLIVWDAGKDLPGVYGTNYRVKVFAEDGYNNVDWQCKVDAKDFDFGALPPEIASVPLSEGNLCFVDRQHVYRNIPKELVGCQYIKQANNDKNSRIFNLEVTLSSTSKVFLFIDDRITNFDLMPWIQDLGFQDTGLNIGIDEGGEGIIDNWSSVYSAFLQQGTTVFRNQFGSSYNMYSIAASVPKSIQSIRRFYDDFSQVLPTGQLYNGSLCCIDRTHTFTSVPELVKGTEYVMVPNDGKLAANYSLEVELAYDSEIFLLLDNRLGDNDSSTPPALHNTGMSWVSDLGFFDSGEDIGIDEYNDGTTNNWFSIYRAAFPRGTVILHQQNDGTVRNMYSVAVRFSKVTGYGLSNIFTIDNRFSPSTDILTVGNLTIRADSITQKSGQERLLSGNVRMNDLLRLTGTVTANTNTWMVRGNGQIWLDDVPGFGNIKLYEGPWEFNGKTGATNALNTVLSQLDVAGMKVRCTNLSLTQNTLKIQGFADLPAKLGGGSIDIDGNHYIAYSKSGGLVYDLTIDKEIDLDVGGFWFKATNSSVYLSNKGGPAVCKIYGRYELSDFLEGVTVNLDPDEGNYFLVTKDGSDVKVEIVGSIFIGKITITPGIYGKNLYLDVDTVNHDYYASGVIGFPVGYTQVEADTKIGIRGGYFDTASIDAQFDPSIVILYSPTVPPVPVLSLGSVGGGIYNLSPLRTKAVVIVVSASLHGGPEFKGYSLVSLELTATLNLSGSFGGDAVLHLGNLGEGKSILDGNAKVLVDLRNGVYLALSVSKSYKGEEFLYLGGITFIGFEKNFAGSMRGRLVVPTNAPIIGALAGGQEISVQAYAQASGDGNDKNDYVAVGGIIVVDFGKKKTIRHAIEINLANGDIDWTGSWDRILDITIPDIGPAPHMLYPPPPSEIVIAPGLDYAIFRVSWERNSTDLNLIRPDGTPVNPANAVSFPDMLYRANDDPLEAFYIVDSPMAGSWQMSVSNMDIGEHTLQVFKESSFPTILLTEPSQSTTETPVNITWTATDTDDDAQISLYYDTDRNNRDGVLITDTLSEDLDTGFLWDTTGIPTGQYYIYAVISDGKNLPVVSYSVGKVSVVDPSAPLPPVFLTASPTGNPGEIRVTWSPSPSEDVDHYNIHYTKGAAGETMDEIQKARDLEGTILTDLTPGETYRIAVSSSDTEGRSGALSDPIIVTLYDDENHAPIFKGGIPALGTKEQLYQFQVLSTDLDGEPIYHSLVVDDPNLSLPPEGMTITQQGLLSWTPSVTQLGINSFAIRLDDGIGGVHQELFTIFVGDENTGNRPPEIISYASPLGTRGTTYIYDIIAVDPDIDDILTYGLLIAPEGADIDNSGSIHWLIPAETVSGRYEFLAKVTDSEGLFELQRFYVQVDNEAPLLGLVNWGILTPTAPDVIQVDIYPIHDVVGFVEYQIEKDGVEMDWQAFPSFQIDSLTPNSSHTFKIRAKDRLGNMTYWTMPTSTYSLAEVPPAPTGLSVDTQTIQVQIHRGLNLEGTQLALYCASHNKWIDVEGQMVEEPVWADVSTWGSILVSDLAMDTTYLLQTKARNQNGIETELSEILRVTTPTPDSRADVQANRKWISAESDSDTSSVRLTAQFTNDPYENTVYAYQWQSLKNADDSSLQAVEGGSLSDDYVVLKAPTPLPGLPTVYQVKCIITGFPQGNSVSRTVDMELRYNHADFDLDGDADIGDLIILAEEWLDESADLSADIFPVAKDNIVNLMDLAEFGKWWMKD